MMTKFEIRKKIYTHLFVSTQTVGFCDRLRAACVRACVFMCLLVYVKTFIRKTDKVGGKFAEYRLV